MLLAWALAWADACAFEEVAGEVLLDVHAVDIVPTAIVIFKEVRTTQVSLSGR